MGVVLFPVADVISELFVTLVWDADVVVVGLELAGDSEVEDVT